jgi:ubiquitin C-terminal hydrolase
MHVSMQELVQHERECRDCIARIANRHGSIPSTLQPSCPNCAADISRVPEAVAHVFRCSTGCQWCPVCGLVRQQGSEVHPLSWPSHVAQCYADAIAQRAFKQVDTAAAGSQTDAMGKPNEPAAGNMSAFLQRLYQTGTCDFCPICKEDVTHLFSALMHIARCIRGQPNCPSCSRPFLVTDDKVWHTLKCWMNGSGTPQMAVTNPSTHLPAPIPTTTAQHKASAKRKKRKLPWKLPKKVELLVSEPVDSVVTQPSTYVGRIAENEEQLAHLDDPLDINPTAEQVLNKGRQLDKAASLLLRLKSAQLSPYIAIASLMDLSREPVQRQIAVQMVSSRYSEFKVSVKTYDKEKPNYFRNCWHHTFADPQISPEVAELIVRHGLMPILERFLVGPEQLPREAPWLMNAAKLLTLEKSPNLMLHRALPEVSQKHGKPSFTVEVAGFERNIEPKKPYKRWSLTKQIDADSVPKGLNIPQIPYGRQIVWSSPNELRDEDGRAFEEAHQSLASTKEWQLGKLIAATFDDYIGSQDDATKALDMLVARYSMRSDIDEVELARRGVHSPEHIRALLPWTLSTRKGRIMIVLKQDRRFKGGKAMVVEASPENLESLIEVLDAVLVKFITGAPLVDVWEHGHKTVDLMTEIAEAGDHPTRPEPCMHKERSRHWHTCHGCFCGFPCSFFPDSTVLPRICYDCDAEGRDAGWLLGTKRDEGGIAPVGDDMAEARKRYKKAYHEKHGRNRRTLRDAVYAWIKEDHVKGKLPWSKQSLGTERDEAYNKIVKGQQADTFKTWWDIYAKQLLDEDVERSVDWTGKNVSPYAPSVEAMRMIHFHHGMSRYHIKDVLAFTSTSMNMMLGNSPKAVAIPLSMLLTSKTLAEHEQAHMLLDRGMVLRWELESNKLWKRVGTAETPYFAALAENFFSLDLPAARYVPRKLLGCTYKVSSQHSTRNVPADWRPPNWANYLQPQIERVAERYGFGKNDRDLWTKNDHTTGNCEVWWLFAPWAFVDRYYVRDAYEMACERMSRVKKLCDNHSSEAYEDDPESRHTMNIERFILALLHLHCHKLDQDRQRPRQYPGQRLRALDQAGFEQVPTMRHPLGLSVGHGKLHGVVMYLGYVNLALQFPLTQGADVFSHEKCNICAESYICNIGRWTEADPDSSEIFNQFKNLRRTKEDMLAHMPEPWPTALPHCTTAQHQQDMNPTCLPPDANFQFKSTARLLVTGQKAPTAGRKDKSGPTRSKTKSKTAANVESDDSSSLSDSATSSDESEELDELDGLDELANLVDGGLLSIVDMPEDDLLDPPDGEGDVVDYSTTPAAQKAALQIRLPPCANIGRGISTCYLSSAVQILYHVFPFKTALRSATISASCADQHTLGLDLGLRLHSQLLADLKTLFTEVELNATSRKQVAAATLQKFRHSCADLNSVMKYDINFNWADSGDQDAYELLLFVLEAVNVATDTSGIKMRTGLTPYAVLQGNATQSIAVLPKLEQDAQNWMVARQDSGYASEVESLYSIQLVNEALCNDPQCGHIRRMFDFEPDLRFTVPGNEHDTPIKLSQLLEPLFHEKLLNVPEARTKCPKCLNGSLVDVVKTIVNEPEVLMININRVDWDATKKAQIRNMRQVQIPELLDLSDFAKIPFSGPLANTSNQQRYRLVGILAYRDQSPHYAPDIRIGKETTSAGGTNRLGRHNDGDWVCFDDMRTIPYFRNPLESLRPDWAATQVIYRKQEADQDQHQEEQVVPEETVIDYRGDEEEGHDIFGSSPPLPEDIELGPAKATTMPATHMAGALSNAEAFVVQGTHGERPVDEEDDGFGAVGSDHPMSDHGPQLDMNKWLERKLRNKEQELNAKEDDISRREEALALREDDVASREEALAASSGSVQTQLQQVTALQRLNDSRAKILDRRALDLEAQAQAMRQPKAQSPQDKIIEGIEDLLNQQRGTDEKSSEIAGLQQMLNIVQQRLRSTPAGMPITVPMTSTPAVTQIPMPNPVSTSSLTGRRPGSRIPVWPHKHPLSPSSRGHTGAEGSRFKKPRSMGPLQPTSRLDFEAGGNAADVSPTAPSPSSLGLQGLTVSEDVPESPTKGSHRPAVPPPSDSQQTPRPTAVPASDSRDIVLKDKNALRFGLRSGRRSASPTKSSRAGSPTKSLRDKFPAGFDLVKKTVKGTVSAIQRTQNKFSAVREIISKSGNDGFIISKYGIRTPMVITRARLRQEAPKLLDEYERKLSESTTKPDELDRISETDVDSDRGSKHDDGEEDSGDQDLGTNLG